MTWIDQADFGEIDPAGHRALAALVPQTLPRGAILFRPGDPVEGFAVVLSGRIEVFLTGPTGREILLYSVAPGQSCVQTTLGLLGEEDYSGEALVATDSTIVLIPRALFLHLMDTGAGFRRFVFAAFAQRMQTMLHVLEKVAFQRIESRLAASLLEQESDGMVQATHAELAARIGSVREVVSRRLEGFVRRGWVETDRGRVLLRDPAALRRLAETDGPA